MKGKMMTNNMTDTDYATQTWQLNSDKEDVLAELFRLGTTITKLDTDHGVQWDEELYEDRMQYLATLKTGLKALNQIAVPPRYLGY